MNHPPAALVGFNFSRRLVLVDVTQFTNSSPRCDTKAKNLEINMASVQIVAAVITISDSASRGEREDRSGPALVHELEKLGARVAAMEIVSDDRELISSKLRLYADQDDINLILTTGGTGFAPRDNTPEATREVIDKEAPGLAELMRLKSLDQTPLAPLSRSVCGIRGRTLIINLPGSTRGAVENFTAIRSVLHHGIDLLSGPAKENQQ